MTAPLTNLGISARLMKKLSPPMTKIDDLYILKPSTLQAEFRIAQGEWDALNARLVACGKRTLGDFPAPKVKEPKRTSLKGKCKKLVMEDGTAPEEDAPFLPGTVICGRENHPSRQSCTWHWLATQPIADQIKWADQRHRCSPAVAQQRERSRVPREEWPEGERWCSGCQDYVPLFYTRGSRCIAHASQAAHASMLKTVYDFTAEDYNNLLAWQRGRCFVCRQLPRVKRLAVDHDHKSGAVRGLLCANDEWGCNRTLARVLNDVGMAERLLAYVQKAPLQRMLDGEPSPAAPTGLAARVGSRAVSDRFAGFLES